MINKPEDDVLIDSLRDDFILEAKQIASIRK
jgi:hypothetical protein